MQIQLGPKAFSFASFQQWVDKAQGWFATRIPPESRGRYLAIDAVGRVCLIGRDFMRARDEGAFPVVVFLVDAVAGEPIPPGECSAPDCDCEPGWCRQRVPATFLRVPGANPPTPMNPVRYCPECGSIGPVRAGARDCCPDGNHAREVPQIIAEQARCGFDAAYGLPAQPLAAGAVPAPSTEGVQACLSPNGEPRRCVLWKCHEAKTCARGASASVSPAPSAQAPAPAPNTPEWIERWHGSGAERGWSIYERNHGNRIAYVGEGEHSERLASVIVEAHNAALAAPAPAASPAGVQQARERIKQSPARLDPHFYSGAEIEAFRAGHRQALMQADSVLAALQSAGAPQAPSGVDALWVEQAKRLANALSVARYALGSFTASRQAYDDQDDEEARLSSAAARARDELDCHLSTALKGADHV